MNAPVASPTISNIKVTTPLEVTGGFRIEWLDEAGTRMSATRFGLTAHRLRNDLHAARLVGEAGERCFLTGFIRGLCDGGGVDT